MAADKTRSRFTKAIDGWPENLETTAVLEQ